MSFKLMWEYLKEKQWTNNELVYALIFVVIASLLTTPIFGIPIGIIAYLYMYERENMEAFKRQRENYRK
ncbi:VraH family peptide resistance protein [Macrococcus lamae]|uniref:VraH family protein n=1 Tax=Macrococcus lamae TaxID=198484 RepID=A0A4R6BTP0_9STAP|nr:hypothetical protein [Macrococcus lamae]TDM07518.1 hypothetical protein ERX29_08775 [Macrococcus lamae]